MALFIFIISLFAIALCEKKEEYYGKYIDSFPLPPRSIHGVKGKLYAVNETTLFIKDFSYDGQGPDAHFWVGNSESPDKTGYILPDTIGRYISLKAYQDQNVLLTLPPNQTLRSIRWLAVWCRTFRANFGHIEIPKNLDFPVPHDSGPLRELAHGTHADNVIILNTKTIYLKNLYYDGQAPDAFFMAGKGFPNPGGTKVPDENNSLSKIHGYIGANIILRLPGEITIFDVDWFGLYCITYTQNFGNINIPKNLNVPPDTEFLRSKTEPFTNCMSIFTGLMKLSWDLQMPDIYFQLEGKINPNEYMSFGISGAEDKAQMVGADVAVAYFDSDLNKAQLVDYSIKHKSQCAPQSRSGVCPDEVILDGRNDLNLLSSSYLDGILKVIYRRRIKTDDFNADQAINPNTMTTIVAAIGLLNSRKEASYHHIAYTSASDNPILITFNRSSSSQSLSLPSDCSSLLSESIKISSSEVKTISKWKPFVIKDEQMLHAAIGPPGGQKGYKAITGIEPWGRAWWINGHMIPEIHVKRGKNYTFIIEGGDDPTFPNYYHPLYITNNPEGGGGQDVSLLNSPEHQVYAGVLFKRGIPDPSPGSGRYCVWKSKTGIDQADELETLEEYENSVHLDCKIGNPAMFTWTPDEDTPDIVYYQCYTHRNLGWKIIVSGSDRLISSLNLIIFLFIVFILYIY